MMGEPAKAQAAIRESMARLDGTTLSAVSLLSGLSPERLSQLGGMPEQYPQDNSSFDGLGSGAVESETAHE